MSLQHASTTDDVSQKIQFSINGRSYVVNSDVHPTTSLLIFLRERASLPGTKACCYEGGCGVCTVVATMQNPETGKQKTFSVKSCQTLVYACSGWAIETIERLGNRYKGYHTLQKVLTNFYGTQCGFCSPGMVMTMYGELRSTGTLTTEQVEKAFDGNLCRCTGYRPILDAYKSLVKNAPTKLVSEMLDIEDLNKSVCSKSGEKCKEKCSGESCKEGKQFQDISAPVTDLELKIGDIQWYRPVSLNGVYKILQKTPKMDRLQLVVGNTGQGVFKDDGPFNVYIDTSGVEELYSVGIGSPLILGANVNINRCIEAFKQMAESYTEFRHLKELANHWSIVANVGIRNVGSWAGNLMLKHKHPEFPSDIFLTLAVANAIVKVGHSSDSSTADVSVEELMKTDMSGNFIISVTIPPQEEQAIIRTYKITPRAVNAHAYVNAAFKFTLDVKDGYKILSKPSLFFGGINPNFVHATATENYLNGQRLSDGSVIIEAANKLGTELIPDSKPQDASPKYRKDLAQALFYKVVLNVLGDTVGPEYITGGLIIQRPISSGQQHFDANKDTWPIGQAIPKLESSIQVAGEAEYVDDMDPVTGELHGAFVQSTVANANILSVDPSAALNFPGVVAYVDAKDIPGINTFVDKAGSFRDPVFVASKISYAGQSIGLIVAERRDIAIKAVKLVQVEYKDIKKPILTIKEALKEESSIDNPEDYANLVNVLEGELEHGSQFHFTMEPLTSRVLPVEDGYDVYVTTQWPTETQSSVARVLGISFNSINLSVKRLGGAYGGKISRQNIVACAAAVAARKLRKPVRIVLDLTTHMTLVGWREPYLSKYKVGFDNDGLLQRTDVALISDAGFVSNETTTGYAFRWIPSVYQCDKWGFNGKSVNTNTAANTYCRTPGSVEAIATIENIIERVAHHLKKDPIAIREKNFVDKEKHKSKHGFGPKGENLMLTQIFPLLKKQALYNERRAEIDIFNKEHRWRKRGLTMVPLYYGLNYPPSFNYNTQIMIYEGDGTVVISHGGIEMGQGINTKVAQVAAKILSVPLHYIKVKSSNIFVGANSAVTGGSFGSDLVAHGIKICCEKISDRMREVAKNMEKPTWQELVSRCSSLGVDICERFWTAANSHPKSYDIFAAVCMEVEVDVLTGQFIMLRTDIIEDCGRSLSPFVDIGQVEGAFIMGLGYYTSEIVKFNNETGQKVSNGTWDYKPPTALDIPTDLRISFLSNSDNPFGVVRSKATGEPALCISYCVVTALRDAIKSARADAGDLEWFDMPTPLTVERIQQLCKVDVSQFVLKAKVETKLDSSLEDFHIVESHEIIPHVEESSCSLN